MSDWAVILGVSSGTGAAIAEAVAADPGLHVFGAHRGRYQEGAAAVRAAVEGAGRRVVLWRGDAGTYEGAQEGAAALEAALDGGRVRLLVHAMASASLGQLASGDRLLHPRQIEKTFDVMAHSFVWWSRALVERGLLADGARLLGLTNPLHSTHLHNTAAISASKAALEMYIRHLAIELGPQGYRVNLLKFGTVMTPALSHVYSEEALARLEQAHRQINTTGTMCTTAEVARFVSLLLGEAAGWFSGATIDFTGGMNLKLLDVVLNPERHREAG